MEFFKLLSAGGDLATIGLFLVLWRFDRRILAVELKLWPNKFGQG